MFLQAADSWRRVFQVHTNALIDCARCPGGTTASSMCRQLAQRLFACMLLTTAHAAVIMRSVLLYITQRAAVLHRTSGQAMNVKKAHCLNKSLYLWSCICELWLSFTAAGGTRWTVSAFLIAIWRARSSGALLVRASVHTGTCAVALRQAAVLLARPLGLLCPCMPAGRSMACPRQVSCSSTAAAFLQVQPGPPPFTLQCTQHALASMPMLCR